jgi:hypothetical protein
MTLTSRVCPQSEFLAAGGKPGGNSMIYVVHCSECHKTGPVSLSEQDAALAALRIGWGFRFKKPAWQIQQWTLGDLVVGANAFCGKCSKRQAKQ